MVTTDSESFNRRRRTDEPSAHVARIGWILLTLIRDGVLDYAACIDHFGISRREFQRDLLKVREIGKNHGLAVSRIAGGRVFMHVSDAHVGRIRAKDDDVLATLSRIAAALGGPIEREMRGALGDAPADQHRGFLHVREAVPSDNAQISGIFSFLKDAAAGPARVEFMYTLARGGRMLRRVEAYHVVVRSGRCYLVAYDLARRDWRYFALDMITGPMRKEGMFVPRTVPERFLAERAVGWISGVATTEITVLASPAVVATIVARVWQKGQRVVPLPDGSAKVSLSFDDIAEAVRWALGFGPDAIVVAPPEAVAVARQMVEHIAKAYSRQVVAKADVVSERGFAVDREILTG